MDASKIKINGFNTNGLGNKFKRLAVVKWLKLNSQSIVFLQETHSIPEIENKWKQDFDNPNLFFSHGTSSGRGVCIILPSNTDFKIIDQISDSKGRYLLIHLKFDNTELVLVNVYMPTKDKKREQLDLLSYVNDNLLRFIDKQIILGGDFNTYLNPDIDKYGG